MAKMKITKRQSTPGSIDDLKPAPYNPRKIGKAAATGLSSSLDAFGDVAGIVWNSRTGHLVCGHQRVEQLKQKGARLEDGKIVLGDDSWIVRVVDWPIEKEKAANVTANNPHIAGEFTDELQDLLSELGQFELPDLDVLCLDKLVIDVGASDLGDGSVGHHVMQRFAVLCPSSEVAAIKKALTTIGAGDMVRCDDEHCNIGVRKLDANSWSERRSKLHSKKVSTREDQDGESSDGA